MSADFWIGLVVGMSVEAVLLVGLFFLSAKFRGL